MSTKYLLKKYSLLFLRPILSSHTYTVRRGISTGLKRKGGLGFIPSQVIPLPKEENFLMKLVLEGQTVYDVGGYQGVFTMFFARAVGKQGKVITFEPNPVNYRSILVNIKLNGFENVEVRPLALAAHNGFSVLVYHAWDPGEGSFETEYKRRNLRSKAARSIEVQMDSLDHQIQAFNLPVPDFVKIDVEGLEMEVLSGMTDTIKSRKPKLFIEVHGLNDQMTLQNARRVVDSLLSRGYSVFHVETETPIQSLSAAATIRGGHIYCT